MAERTSVVLLGPDGEIDGVADKLEAHRSPGAFHLAFSVFLYRPDGAVLLQQRSPAKYHFPGVWANACCSHPEPGEDLVASAERRVAEELGVACRLVDAGSFSYRAVCPSSGLVEHELDHVLVATVDAEPVPDPSEVAATRWVDPDHLLAATDPDGPSVATPTAGLVTGPTALTATPTAGAVASPAPSRSAGPTTGAVVPSPLAPWLGPALRLAEAARRRCA